MRPCTPLPPMSPCPDVVRCLTVDVLCRVSSTFPLGQPQRSANAFADIAVKRPLYALPVHVSVPCCWSFAPAPLPALSAVHLFSVVHVTIVQSARIATVCAGVTCILRGFVDVPTGVTTPTEWAARDRMLPHTCASAELNVEVRRRLEHS